MEYYSKHYQKVTKLGIQSTNKLLVYLKNHFLEGNKTTIGVYTLVYRDGQFVSLTRQK